MAGPKPNVSLKDRIENNPVVFFLTALVTELVAGMGAYTPALKLVN